MWGRGGGWGKMTKMTRIGVIWHKMVIYAILKTTNIHPPHRMKQLKKSQYVMIGAVALIALFPLATSVDGDSFDIELPASVSMRQATMNQAEFRMQRREYSKVREVCLERAKKDETVECPDFNDPFGVRKFLQTQEKVEIGESEAMDEGNIMLHLVDLDSYQRGLLRRYHRVNSCPESLNGVLPGFYELCLSYISQMHPKFRGLINDRANAARMKQEAAE